MDGSSDVDSDLEYQAKKDTALSSKAKLDSLTKQRDAARKNIQKSFNTKLSAIKNRMRKSTETSDTKQHEMYKTRFERLRRAVEASVEIEEAIARKIAELEVHAEATASHLGAVFEGRRKDAEEAAKVLDEAPMLFEELLSQVSRKQEEDEEDGEEEEEEMD